MPSPKNGKAGSAIAPAEPKEAKEADKADPGEVEKAKAEQRQAKAGKYGSVSLPAHKPPATEEEKKKKNSWIEIELCDKEGKPVPGEPYEVILPDGQSVASGTLDEKGFARIEGIEPGNCQVVFPRHHNTCWKPK
jgi:hypothetical protein